MATAADLEQPQDYRAPAGFFTRDLADGASISLPALPKGLPTGLTLRAISRSASPNRVIRRQPVLHLLRRPTVR